MIGNQYYVPFNLENMQRCISVPFDFKGKEYYAIVRQYAIDHKVYYKIRIMNHRLDSMLHKSNLNIIEECDGHLAIPNMDKWTLEGELSLSVIQELIMRLSNYDEHNQYDLITEYGLLTPF
ncbi:MAG: hypothetical protein EOP48_16430 [Sphingobacteriales bacterium]|nr:MAG: hypothetical protein EOP48_16430 [Sphingobacteriales bacterium]